MVIVVVALCLLLAAMAEKIIAMYEKRAWEWRGFIFLFCILPIAVYLALEVKHEGHRQRYR